jgi:hypothetical protein
MDSVVAGPLAAGLEIILDQAARNATTREQQIQQLDRRVAAVQRLIEDGKYDEAELLLVDIHWVPVEPGARSEEEFKRIFDEKRAALGRVLQRKRAQ